MIQSILMENLKKNEIFPCEITGWSSDGAGVTHIDGKTIFVPGTIPGERWEVRILKARAKVYVADAAIRNAVLMDESLLSNPTELGKVVETTVHKHVASFYYQLATRVGYSRGGPKDKEVDIVVDYPNIKNILIEVKYREQAPIPDDDAIVELSKDASAAIVVTKRADDYGTQRTPDGQEIIRIPAFAFLYLLGNAEQHGYKGKE